MNEDSKKQDLARRAVNCKGWRWLDGSHWVNGDTDGDADVFEDGGESSNYPRFGIVMRGDFFEQEDYNPSDPDEPLPDLSDPATLGCLLALVREAWELPVQVNPPRSTANWLVYALTGRGENQLCELVGRGDTEAAALVAALEAAP